MSATDVKEEEAHLAANEALGKELEQPAVVLDRVVAGGEEQEVEHGHVALVEQWALEQEPVKGRVQWRLGRRDHLQRVREEERDHGRDRLARLAVDAVARVGEDEQDLLAFAEGE